VFVEDGTVTQLEEPPAELQFPDYTPLTGS